MDIINFGLTVDHNYEILDYLSDETLSRLPLMPFQIDILHNRLDWNIISNKYMPGWLFIKHADKINWEIFITNEKPKSIAHLTQVKKYLLCHKKLFSNAYVKTLYYSNEFAACLPQLIDWNWFCKRYQIDHYLLIKYWDLIKPRYISEYQKLTIMVIKNKYNSICWDLFSKNKYLSEEIMHEYSNKLNWIIICKYQRLSMQFIESHRKYCIPYYISRYQNLTESFIEKNKKWLDWTAICEYQELSFEFLKRHAKLLFMNNLIKNKAYNKPGCIQVWRSSDNWHIAENSIITTHGKILFYSDPLIADKDCDI